VVIRGIFDVEEGNFVRRKAAASSGSPQLLELFGFLLFFPFGN
jgi:hypothetical protein